MTLALSEGVCLEQNIVFLATRIKHVVPETLHVKLDRQRTDRTITNTFKQASRLSAPSPEVPWVSSRFLFTLTVIAWVCTSSFIEPKKSARPCSNGSLHWEARD